MITFAAGALGLGDHEVIELYDSVGWTAYTDHPDRLMAGIRASLRVVAARADGRLCGLARAVGDGETIVYVQDVLVSPRDRRRGIGAGLMEALSEPFGHVRQTVLLTDTDPGQKAFYESLGFAEVSAEGTNLRSFIRFR